MTHSMKNSLKICKSIFCSSLALLIILLTYYNLYPPLNFEQGGDLSILGFVMVGLLAVSLIGYLGLKISMKINGK